MRPRPMPMQDGRPFWDGLREYVLVLPFCTECAEFCYPPRPRCPRCLGTAVEWRRTSGTGTVWSWAEVRHPFTPGVPVPYVVAEIELDDQPGLLIDSTLVGAAAGQLRLGAPVTVTFVDDERGFTVHAFRLAEPSAPAESAAPAEAFARGGVVDTTSAPT